MRPSFQTSKQREARPVNCSHCNATLQAHSLLHHLTTLHGVYQQTVVVGELLDKCPIIMYTAEQCPDGKLQCPINGCLGILKDGWDMQRHFRDIHSWDKVIVQKEGQSYLRCEYCGMQTNPMIRGHWRTESCSLGADRRVQRNTAVTSALALQCTFMVHGDVLEQVKVFST